MNCAELDSGRFLDVVPLYDDASPLEAEADGPGKLGWRTDVGKRVTMAGGTEAIAELGAKLGCWEGGRGTEEKIGAGAGAIPVAEFSQADIHESYAANSSFNWATAAPGSAVVVESNHASIQPRKVVISDSSSESWPAETPSIQVACLGR